VQLLDPSAFRAKALIVAALLVMGVGSAKADLIGRANLDGTGVNNNFITPAGGPAAVAIDNTFIYWTDEGSGIHTLGRANLNGTGVNDNFITTGNTPLGVAVDGTHIYWSLNAVVPEPSTGLLVMTGVLGLTAARRMKT
jgi:hypothetical protein